MMVSTKFSVIVTLFLISCPYSQSLEVTRRVKSKSGKAASKSIKSEKSVKTKSPKSKSSKSKSSKKSWEYPKITKSPTLQPKKQTKSPKSINSPKDSDSHKVSKSTKVTSSPSTVGTDAIVTASPTVRTTPSPITSSPTKSPSSSPFEEDAVLSPNIIQCSLVDQQEDGTSQSMETTTVSLDYAIVTSTIDEESLNKSLRTLESEIILSLADMCNDFDRKLLAHMKRRLQVKSLEWGPMNIEDSNCGIETCDISLSNEVEVITTDEDPESDICEMISLIKNALDSILMMDSLGLEDAHLDSSYACHPKTQDDTPTTAQNEPTSLSANTNVGGEKDIGLFFVSGAMIAIIVLVIMKVVISKETHHEIEKSEHQVEIVVGEDETLCTDEGSSRLLAKTLSTGSYKFVDDQVDQNDCEENDDEHEHSSLEEIEPEPIEEIEVDTRSFISSISDLMNAF